MGNEEFLKCSRCIWYDNCLEYIHGCSEFSPSDDLDIYIKEYQKDLEERDEWYQEMIDEYK